MYSDLYARDCAYILGILDEEYSSSIATEGFFDMFRPESILTWKSQLFGTKGFLNAPLNRLYVKPRVWCDDKYIWIQYRYLTNILDDCKSLFDHSPLAKIFIHQYTFFSQQRYNKKKIKKTELQIEKLKLPIFYAPEAVKLFVMLKEKTGKTVYGNIANMIYKTSWLSEVDNKPVVNRVDLSRLENLRYDLKPFQKEFIMKYDSLKQGLNLNGYILGFKQGLGKTFTAVALAECLNKRAVYIVCPNSLTENWAKELKSYYKKYDDPKVFAKEVSIVTKANASTEARFYIVNNESIPKMYPFVKERGRGTMIIIDESHNFRNIMGKRTNELVALKDKVRPDDVLPMSGTPIKLTPAELGPMLRMIDPLFTDEAAKIYQKAFDFKDTDAMAISDTRLKRVMYVKTKDVLELPDKYISNISIKLRNESVYWIETVNGEIMDLFNEIMEQEMEKVEDMRRELVSYVQKYSRSNDQLKKMYLEWITKYVNTKKNKEFHDLDYEEFDKYLETYVIPYAPDSVKKRLKVLEPAFIKIRQSCLGRAIGAILPGRRTDMYKDLWDSGKSDFINRIKSCEDKTIIFTQFKGAGKHIYQSLLKSGIGTVLIDGDVVNQARNAALDQFHNNPDVKVLIATSQTLATGVTLVEATQMFFFGTPWRSADFEQACDRIHRIGQTKDVYIYTVSLDSERKSLSDRIDQRLSYSEKMVNAAFAEIDLSQAN